MKWDKTLSRAYFAEFKGAGIVIAGGAAGIGASLADAFRFLGAKTVILDRTQVKDGIAADLSQEKSRAAAIAAAAKQAGRVKAFISTIGLDRRIAFDGLTQDKAEELMRVNFYAPFFAARDVMPAMRRAGGGAICLFTSRHGSEIFAPDMTGYGCAKAALDSGIRRLAVAAGEKNTAKNIIRVFGLCPGWVQTGNQTARFSKRQFADAAREQLVPAAMKPEDIVPMVVFGLSSHAKLLTGTTLRYDGGEGQVKTGAVAKGSRK